jgi:hypothetical protein
MDRKDLDKLRRNLPPKAKELLAEQFNVSVGHITQVLLGNRNNELVLIAAAEMAAEHKNKLSKAEEFVQSLSS